jgi:hypothetical protein
MRMLNMMDSAPSGVREAHAQPDVDGQRRVAHQALGFDTAGAAAMTPVGSYVVVSFSSRQACAPTTSWKATFARSPAGSSRRGSPVCPASARLTTARANRSLLLLALELCMINDKGWFPI